MVAVNNRGSDLSHPEACVPGVQAPVGAACSRTDAFHLMSDCKHACYADLQEVKPVRGGHDTAHPGQSRIRRASAAMLPSGQRRPLQRTNSESSLRPVSDTSLPGFGETLKRTSSRLTLPDRLGRPIGPRPDWDCSAGEHHGIGCVLPRPIVSTIMRCCRRRLLLVALNIIVRKVSPLCLIAAESRCISLLFIDHFRACMGSRRAKLD